MDIKFLILKLAVETVVGNLPIMRRGRYLGNNQIKNWQLFVCVSHHIKVAAPTDVCVGGISTEPSFGLSLATPCNSISVL